MFRSGLQILMVLAAFAASTITVQAADQKSESEKFLDFLNGVYEQTVQASPMLAASFGSKENNDKWDDLSPAAAKAHADRVRADIQTAVTGFDYAKLNERTKLQYRVFLDEERLLLNRYRWRDQLYPLNQIVGLQVEVPNVLINQHPIDNIPDAQAYIKRLYGVGPLFDQLIANMKAQAGKGIYMPKTIYPTLTREVREVISGAPYEKGPDSPVWADFKRKVKALDIQKAQKKQLLGEAQTALTEAFAPAYRKLLALLEEQGKATPIDGGVWQLPDGDAFYAFLIRQFTTTNMSPDEIHEMGLREVARVHHEMHQIMEEVGFHGTLKEFMAKTKADKRFYYPNTPEGRRKYLERARKIVHEMERRIPEDFLAPAPLPLVVERTDSYKESSAPSGYYEAGSADGKRPGVIYLNLSNMKVMPTYDMEDLLYHEGVPGHHMQISTILVDKSIPRLRKVNQWWQDSAFVEGWGLYAEHLGKDMGLYKDPYSDFGRLAGELWRACRLVVDSGLHYKHWSRDQAVQYLNENTPRSGAANIMSVDRYLAVPGQATSFMVGMKKFLALRSYARKTLGPRFDIREFHDVVLKNGFVPLWAVEDSVNDWIDSKRK